MIKKLFIVSTIIFLVVAALPFKSNKGGFINPKPLKVKTQEKQQGFYKTAKRAEYTQSQEISFANIEKNGEGAPSVQAVSAVAIDLNNSKIIYKKNETQQMPVASLVKVMTAILAMEHSDINKKAVVSKNAAEIGENTMGLVEGEKLVIKDLLYGLILNSGNDAALTIAEHVAGNESSFVEYMNTKAKLIGANNTLFSGASGLNPNDLENYSTAVDMAKIAAYSLATHPTLREIYQTYSYDIPYTDEHGLKILENQTNLLTTYPGVKGIKTGYTEEAGLCLISYAENGGEKVLVVVLNSSDRKGDAILLLDHAFETLGVKVEHDLL
jgi:D-alanyl-D-alanine carboxypeptidase